MTNAKTYVVMIDRMPPVFDILSDTSPRAAAVRAAQVSLPNMECPESWDVYVQAYAPGKAKGTDVTHIELSADGLKPVSEQPASVKAARYFASKYNNWIRGWQP